MGKRVKTKVKKCEEQRKEVWTMTLEFLKLVRRILLCFVEAWDLGRKQCEKCDPAEKCGR